MPTITVKNIPDDLYERLKRMAESNRRSINSEIIHCIEKSVTSQPVDPDAMLATAHLIREKTAHYHISDEEFNRLKNAGRQ